jgi:hypothetical protein
MARKPDTETLTATIGFEAKRWLTADSRSEAETAEGNLRNDTDSAEPSGARQPAECSPHGQHGGADQYNRERTATDGVKIGFGVYCIRTKVPGKGGKVDKSFVIDHRSKASAPLQRWLLQSATRLHQSIFQKAFCGLM